MFTFEMFSKQKLFFNIISFPDEMCAQDALESCDRFVKRTIASTVLCRMQGMLTNAIVRRVRSNRIGIIMALFWTPMDFTDELPACSETCACLRRGGIRTAEVSTESVNDSLPIYCPINAIRLIDAICPILLVNTDHLKNNFWVLRTRRLRLEVLTELEVLRLQDSGSESWLLYKSLADSPSQEALKLSNRKLNWNP